MFIKGYESYQFTEVRRVTEWKDGMIFKTEHVGYARRERPKQDGEVYCSISTEMTKHGFETELID